MTGPEIRAIRESLGLTQTAWGRMLGLDGNDESVRIMVSMYERGVRPVPRTKALLAEMIAARE